MNTFLCADRQVSARRLVTLQVIGSIKVDDETGKNIAEMMTEFHTKAVTIKSEAEAVIGNAQLDVRPPVQVLVWLFLHKLWIRCRSNKFTIYNSHLWNLF